MSTRNSDASQLTALRANNSQAYFFNRQLANGYSTANPQTGTSGASRVPQLIMGVIGNTYRTGGSLPLVSDQSCTCTAGLPIFIQRN